MNWLVAPFRWLLAAPARWLGNARGFFGWSLPFRVAIILSIFLLLCVIGYYAASAWLDERAVFSPKLDPRFIARWLLLVVAIPIAAYVAVRAWLETEPSQFPDIDDAWERGATAVARAGINLDQVPLFLATGVASPVEADHVMHAVDWELVVEGEPEGKAPLRWYASRDVVVLFLLDASAASALQAQAERMAEWQVPSGGGDVRGTLLGPGPGAAAAATPPATGSPATGIRGTILAGAAPTAAPGPAPASSGIRGTMLAGQTPAGPATAQPLGPVGLDRKQIAEQADRLARVCRLAKQFRQPLCPFNGSITIVDWETLIRAPEGQLAATVREDAVSMIQASQLHAPMALLIKGLDSESGFIELVRRVGEAPAHDNRFGHGFNHQSPLEPGQLSALAHQACGAFEDWIYDLFRHADALSRSNNDKLYTLLCKMRNEVQPKIVDVVSSLAGATVPAGQRGPLLCGCYFGAAGGSRMRQAFVRSVFDKLLELEEDLEWSEEAWQHEFAYQNMVRGMLIMNAALIVALTALLIYYFFF